MSPYAATTAVPMSRTRNEIEQVLARYGADQFAFMTSPAAAAIAFVADGRQIRFTLTMPAAEEFTLTPTGKRRTAAATAIAQEQAVRQRWRALLLIVKAKLEAIESGITTFEEEFLAHVVMPDGSTVGESVAPAIARAYATGQVTPLLGR